ncbi:MAG: ABC transporter permease [Albidovulum sp.]|uniref:ABC transporter permease n=1 Tax=Albidovulum sp. TaxID=1872424 RepID=UPI003C91491C
MNMQPETRLAAGLLSPALLVITIFMVVPIAITTIYSFLEPARYGGVVWNFSAEAYIRVLFERDIFDDSLSFSTDYIRIFARSLIQAGVATVLCLMVGIPAAWFIATRSDRQKSVWLVLITIPYWVNLLVRTIALLLILRDEGPINSGLQSLGLTSGPLPLAYNDFAVGLGLVYSFLPFMILPLYAAFERFDFRLLEAAYDLHANRFQAVFKVVLPILKPGIVAGSLLVFIPGIGAFLAPDILGGGKTLMIGNLIGQQFQGSRNWPFGAALSTILLVFTLIALFWSARRSAKAGGEVI